MREPVIINCLVHGQECLRCGIAMDFEIDILRKERDMLLAAYKEAIEILNVCVEDDLLPMAYYVLEKGEIRDLSKSVIAKSAEVLGKGK